MFYVKIFYYFLFNNLHLLKKHFYLNKVLKRKKVTFDFILSIPNPNPNPN